MLRKAASFGAKDTRILYRNSQDILFYKSTFHQSNDVNPVGISTDAMTQLFGSTTGSESLQVTQEMLTRSDFGFYQRLLPIDTVQAIMHNINFLFDTPYWIIVMGLPFITKALITMPIHFHQQKKYESRLSTLPMAVYEMHCITNRDMTSRKRGSHNHNDMLNNRKELKNKYGFNASTTQLLPYTAAMVQLPVHMTMFVAIRTMSSNYPLWSEGGPSALQHLQNLSVIDSSYILPVSIGCSMALLQFMVFERNKHRGAGLSTNTLLAVNGTATVAIACFALNWSIGFNLYILSNLTSYTVQLGLMDTTLFRNMVGLKAYALLKPDVKKLQIIYQCHRMTMQRQTKMKQEYAKQGADTASLNNRMPSFQTAAVALLQDPENFKASHYGKQDLDAVLDDIVKIGRPQTAQSADITNDTECDDVDDDDEDVYGYSKGEGKQYSFEFTSQDDIDARRRQIQKSMKGTTTRSFLMSQKGENVSDEDEDIENEEEQENNEEYHENVTIQNVDQDNGFSNNLKRKHNKNID